MVNYVIADADIYSMRSLTPESYSIADLQTEPFLYHHININDTTYMVRNEE